MLNTAEDFSSSQQTNQNEIQALLQKAQERVQYFIDIDLDIIKEWVQKYNECLNKIEQYQMNVDLRNSEELYSKLSNLINSIEIIKTEGMVLVGKFKPWMSGVGMINFPNGLRIYGNITFGMLNGWGVATRNQNKMKFIGTFNKNFLQGEGTIILNNQFQFRGQFDKGKIKSGPIQINFLNEPQKEIQAQLNIDEDLIEIRDRQQLIKLIKLTNFQYRMQDNIRYEAPQFLLGQDEKRSFSLYQNENLRKEYRDGILYYGLGQAQKPGNIILKGMFQDGQLSGNGELIDNTNDLLWRGEFQNDRMRRGRKYCLSSNILLEEENFNEQMQLTGTGKRYSNNTGLILEEGEFQNGKLEGNGIRYCENQIKEKGIFQDGILILGTKYHQNGKIQEKGEFNNIGLIGEGERRHQNGYINEYGIFKDGKLHSSEFKSGRANENGVIIEIGYFQNGFLEGEGEKYYPSGKKSESGIYQRGQLYGGGKKYYDNENNSLKEEGFYQNGLLNNTPDTQNFFYQYYKDGSLKSEGLFKNGQLESDNGHLYFNEYEMKGVFRNGQKSGTSILINSQNNQEYRNDKLQTNAAFLEEAFNAGVYTSQQFNTDAERSFKRKS